MSNRSISMNRKPRPNRNNLQSNRGSIGPRKDSRDKPERERDLDRDSLKDRDHREKDSRFDREREHKEREHVTSTPPRSRHNSKDRDRSLSPINCNTLINAQFSDPPSVKSYSDNNALHQPGRGYNITEWVKHIERMGASGLVLEYQQIRREPTSGMFNAYKANKDKNRYQDVLCCDHTRVKLTDGLEGHTDYIHANYIDGYKQRKAYICTQGPLKNTFIDFWRMIWQEKVLIIVMTTRMVERNREKCGQYWPTSAKKPMAQGHFFLSLKKVIHDEEYDLSYLLVTHRGTEEQRLICHILYHAWPDYKVPKSPSNYLALLRLIHRIQTTQMKLQFPDWEGHPMGPPVIIHCSAGIGRTGTFCAIDICIARLVETKKLDVAEVVRKIRSQRVHSIQTPEQYMFIHLVLIEFAVNSGMYNVDKLDLSGFVDDNAPPQ